MVHISRQQESSRLVQSAIDAALKEVRWNTFKVDVQWNIPEAAVQFEITTAYDREECELGDILSEAFKRTRLHEAIQARKKFTAFDKDKLDIKSDTIQEAASAILAERKLDCAMRIVGRIRDSLGPDRVSNFSIFGILKHRDFEEGFQGLTFVPGNPQVVLHEMAVHYKGITWASFISTHKVPEIREAYKISETNVPQYIKNPTFFRDVYCRMPVLISDEANLIEFDTAWGFVRKKEEYENTSSKPPKKIPQVTLMKVSQEPIFNDADSVYRLIKKSFPGTQPTLIDVDPENYPLAKVVSAAEEAPEVQKLPARIDFSQLHLSSSRAERISSGLQLIKDRKDITLDQLVQEIESKILEIVDSPKYLLDTLKQLRASRDEAKRSKQRFPHIEIDSSEKVSEFVLNYVVLECFAQGVILNSPIAKQIEESASSFRNSFRQEIQRFMYEHEDAKILRGLIDCILPKVLTFADGLTGKNTEGDDPVFRAGVLLEEIFEFLDETQLLELVEMSNSCALFDPQCKDDPYTFTSLRYRELIQINLILNDAQIEQQFPLLQGILSGKTNPSTEEETLRFRIEVSLLSSLKKSIEEGGHLLVSPKIEALIASSQDAWSKYSTTLEPDHLEAMKSLARGIRILSERLRSALSNATSPE